LRAIFISLRAAVFGIHPRGTGRPGAPSLNTEGTLAIAVRQSSDRVCLAVHGSKEFPISFPPSLVSGQLVLADGFDPRVRCVCRALDREPLVLGIRKGGLCYFPCLYIDMEWGIDQASNKL